MFYPYYISILLAFFISTSVYSLVSCSPASCTAPCDGSCQYKFCDGASSVTVNVDRLPFEIIDITPDACDFASASLLMAPFNVDETTYNDVPASVTKNVSSN